MMYNIASFTFKSKTKKKRLWILVLRPLVGARCYSWIVFCFYALVSELKLVTCYQQVSVSAHGSDGWTEELSLTMKGFLFVISDVQKSASFIMQKWDFQKGYVSVQSYKDLFFL